MSKIIGNPVGTTLPKPDWNQTDPTKGDYIKNKPEIVNPTIGQFLVIKSIDEDGHITMLESIDFNIDYDSNLAFDTTEIVINNLTNTTSVLGQAILGQMVLA